MGGEGIDSGRNSVVFANLFGPCAPPAEDQHATCELHVHPWPIAWQRTEQCKADNTNPGCHSQ